jgi:TPR repeat protein
MPAAPRSSFDAREVFSHPQFAQAYRYWQDGQFAEVLAIVRPIALQGDPVGQYLMGKLYASGGGVPQDEEQAFRWWRKSAEQGLAWAQNEVGIALLDGWGAAADPRQAVSWFRKAAAQGMAVAQVNLGLMYLNGVGVRRSEREAVEQFRDAAERGLGWAQYYLGIAYADGRGVTQNLARAAEWIRRAAEQGYTDAQYSLGLIYLRGHGVDRDDARAIFWLARAARDGNLSAARYLEQLVALRPRMPLPVGTEVRNAAAPSAAVVATTTEPERAYVLERRRDWTEIYLERGHTLGFIASKAGRGQQEALSPVPVVTDACTGMLADLSGRQSNLDAQRTSLATEAGALRARVATQFDALQASLDSLAGEQFQLGAAAAGFEPVAAGLKQRVAELDKLVKLANSLPEGAGTFKAWLALREQITREQKALLQDLAAAQEQRRQLKADQQVLAEERRLHDKAVAEAGEQLARMNGRIEAYNGLSAAFDRDVARYETSCGGSVP